MTIDSPDIVKILTADAENSQAFLNGTGGTILLGVPIKGKELSG